MNLNFRLKNCSMCEKNNIANCLKKIFTIFASALHRKGASIINLAHK